MDMFHSNHITKITHKRCFQLLINWTGKVSDGWKRDLGLRQKLIAGLIIKNYH